MNEFWASIRHLLEYAAKIGLDESRVQRELKARAHAAWGASELWATPWGMQRFKIDRYATSIVKTGKFKSRPSQRLPASVLF